MKTNEMVILALAAGVAYMMLRNSGVLGASAGRADKLVDTVVRGSGSLGNYTENMRQAEWERQNSVLFQDTSGRYGSSFH